MSEEVAERPWDAFLRTTGGDLPADGYADTLDRFIDLCHARGLQNVLELGCGSGPVSLCLLEAGLRVRCVDDHEASLRRLIDRLTPMQRSLAHVDLSSFSELRIEPESIEAVVAVRSINHGLFDEVHPRFRQVAEGLQVGGLMLLYVASDNDFRKRLGHRMCSRTTVPTDGPEEGIPHVFPSSDDLNAWMPHLRFLHRARYEIRVPRNSAYFDAYSRLSRLQMRLRQMFSSHHTILAEKVSPSDAITEEQ